jgi:hypothetical protein
MNKLEERHLEFVSVAYYANPNQPYKDAEAHATITKEIAIGFKDWADLNTKGWVKSEYFGKSDEQLFEMYINTLK